MKAKYLLLSTVVILGAYAWWDYRKEAREVSQNLEKAKLVPYPKEQISEVHLKKGSHEFLMKKTPEGWYIEKPIQDWANEDSVDIFLSTGKDEAVLDTVAEGENINWDLYGLKTPHAQITYKTNSGESVIYFISDKTTYEQNTYLRRNQENKVYLVAGTWQARAEKGESELRDMRLLRHKMGGIDKASYVSSQTRFQLLHQQGKWVLEGKESQALEQNNVYSFLQAIADAQASRIVSTVTPSFADKKLYGLDKPQAEITLSLGDKKWKAVFGIGQNQSFYAWVENPGFLLQLDRASLDKIIHVSEKSFLVEEKK